MFEYFCSFHRTWKHRKQHSFLRVFNQKVAMKLQKPTKNQTCSYIFHFLTQTWEKVGSGRTHRFWVAWEKMKASGEEDEELLFVAQKLPAPLDLWICGLARQDGGKRGSIRVLSGPLITKRLAEAGNEWEGGNNAVPTSVCCHPHS